MSSTDDRAIGGRFKEGELFINVVSIMSVIVGASKGMCSDVLLEL